MATQISQQERIRRMFVKGVSRADIHKKLGIRYQIVFKATNVKYAPKSWSDRLTNAHNGKFESTTRKPKSKTPEVNS